MSYSASTFSRVDKAWPKMSDSTEERIKRLRELEQRRLEKLELLSKRTSEPVPMPKFVSRISSSRKPTPFDNVETHLLPDTTETFVVPGTMVTGIVVSKNSVSESAVKVKTETEKVPFEVSTKERNDAEKRRDIDDQRELRNTDTKIRLGDNETKTGLESSKNETRSSSFSNSSGQQSVPSHEQSNKYEPSRTLSTSYVEGPLSPTSTEKTRISVVRKTKLDSLPPVTTAVITAKTVELEDTKTDPLISSSLVHNFSKESGKSISSATNVTSETPHTESYMTLQEFKDVSGIVEISKRHSTDVVVSKDNDNLTSSEIMESVVPSLNSTASSVKSSSAETLTVSSTVNPITTTEESKTGLKISTDRNRPSEPGISQHTSAKISPSDTDETSGSTSNNTGVKESVFRLGTFAMKKELELKAKIDEKFSSDDSKVHMAKLEELQKKREERKKALEGEEKEDLSQLPVRERFFRTQSVGRITRPVRQQSIPEQIRASRQSRRASEQASRTQSPGKAAEAESPPSTRRSRLQQRSIDRLRRRTIDSVPVLPSSKETLEERPKPKPVLDLDSIDEAFSRPYQERFSRLEELDRIRIQNKEYMKRRDSAPILANEDVVGIHSARLDFPSSLIVNRGSSENIARYPIHEHLESSFHSSRLSATSTDDVVSRSRELLRSLSIDRAASSHSNITRPVLRASYSESRLFPLDGGRLTGILSTSREPENLDQNLAPSNVLTVSTEREHAQLDQGSNQEQSAAHEIDDTPVYMEGSPQGTPLVDNEGRTHWVGPTSPRLRTYLNIMDRLENRNRSSSFDSSFGNVSSKKPKINSLNNLLDPVNHDHYLAECFDKKYTLKERCSMIREKLYGKDTKTDERGKPDGASHDMDNFKTNVDISQ